jgi:hypothetical protein
MYRRPCNTQWEKARIPYCPPVIGSGSAMSESARMAEQVCRSAWVTSIAGPQCVSDISNAPVSQTVRFEVPVRPGAPMPYVQVGTTPARLTTQQYATAAVFNNYDPYNPTTRFSQYFPPAPRPYICPERIPNNLPIPRSICVPITRYEGSQASIERQAREAQAAAAAAAPAPAPAAPAPAPAAPAEALPPAGAALAEDPPA